jgi:hypothetical protein
MHTLTANLDSSEFIRISDSAQSASIVSTANALEPTSISINITIDTVVAVPGAPDLAAGSDSGASNTDNITNAANPVFTGGGAEAGATVRLYAGPTQVGSAVADAGGNWSVTASGVAAGSGIVFTADQVDVAGNVSAVHSAGLTVTIDRTAPVAPSVPDLIVGSDSGASNTDNITNVAAPTFSGTAEAGATVILYDGATQVGTAQANAGGAWSITSATLGQGAHSLSATATDAAGNVSAASTALSVTIDTAAAAPAAPDLAAGSDSGASNTDNITNAANPVFTGGGAEAGATVRLYAGATQVGSAVADASGNWSVTAAGVAAGSGIVFTADQVDVAGNVSAVHSAGLTVTIDRTAPTAPSVPDLVTGSDSGASNTDNITNVAAPTFSGTAEAGATVILYDGVTQVGTAQADVGGAWSITSATLGQGAHSLSATATDAAGNVSAASAALTVTVDTDAPTAPAAPVLAAGSDSGASNTDNITNVAALTFSGTAEAGATVILYDGAVQVGTAQADVGGAWSITSATLGQGAHSLSATATDAAGNVSAASAALTVTVDTDAPTAPAAPVLAAGSDSGASNTDNITNVAALTFSGTAEAGATVILYDGAVQVGTAQADVGGAWSITSATLGQGAHSLSATATDAAGNVSAASAALTVTVDTDAPTAPAAPVLAAGSDSGSSNADNITNVAAPTFSGTAEAGATVILYDGAVQVGTAQADVGGAWSITSATLGQGAHSLSATATDAAGNVSAASAALTVTVDTNAPTAPAAPVLVAESDSGSSNADNITNVAAPTFSGTAEAGATVILYDGAVQVGTAQADVDGAWSITSATLVQGAHSLSATATDAADNVSAASAALTVTVDTDAPTAPAAPVLAAGSDSGSSNVDNITNVAAPTFSGTAEAGATVILYDGAVQVGTAQANAGGAWSITSATLVQGAHSLSATATDAAGNVSAASAALTVTVDTDAPTAPAAPVLAAGSDSGSSNVDNITNVAAPTFSGTAEAGATVILYDGITQVGTVQADAGGAWSITSATLSQGAHSLSATATDAAGNVSAASAALTVTVDTDAPTAPAAPVLAAGSDSGSSNSDNITNVAAPTFSGTAEAGATVILYDGVTQVGTAQADAGGAWSITSATLGQGAHSLSATATDAAGNVSAASAALTVTVDTDAPTAPAAPVLVAGSDSGSSNVDNITNVAAPTFSGTAEAGATVILYDGAVQVGTAQANAGGTWSITSATLSQGAHSLSATATDAAGNVSAASAALTVTVDTDAPTAPAAPVLAVGSDSGSSNVDNITNIAAPTFSGTAEAGATVILYDGAVQVGTAQADVSGAWSITNATLGQGAHSLSATATDAAGNVSVASAALSITIDTAAAAPAAPDLAVGSDSGSSNTDNITNAANPVFTGGGAEAGATVRLYAGATQVGSAVADASGNWSVTASGVAAGSGIVFTADQVDVAGNVSAVHSAGLTVTIDRTAPTAPSVPDLVTGSDSGASNTDNITNVAAPTFSGTAEAGATITLYDGAVQVGTAQADAGGAWSITSATLGQGAHSLSATATDAAGNVSAASAALTVTIDTAAAAPAAPDLAAGSDSGASNTDNITNAANPVFTGGGAEAGATVRLYAGAVQVGSALADASGNWSVTASGVAAGSGIVFTADQVDVAGNISAVHSAGLTVTIDRTAPTAPSVPDLIVGSDSGASNTDNITNVAAPTFSGTAEAGATITLYDGAVQVGTAQANAGGAWSITSATLGQGAHSLSATATDAAGNVSVASTALAVTIDTAAAAPAAPDLAAGSDSGSSNTDNITNAANPVFTGGGAEAGATVRLYAGAVQVGSAVADASGNWSVTAAGVAAGSGIVFTADQVDVAGNVSAVHSAGLTVTIDRTAPVTPSVPDLIVGSDSGVSNTDNITNVAAPTFSGTAEAGATINLYDGAVQVGTAQANAGGAWSITSATLSQGAHSLSATATDAAGNVSVASAALAVTIDTAAAAPAAPDLAAGSDSGASNTDNITNAANPVFTGGGAEAGATVRLYAGATQVGSAVADASGNWSVTASGVAAGSGIVFTADQVDVAGNVSAVHSAGLTVTVDRSAPTAPSAPDLIAGSDSGSSNSDNITNVAAPTFSGTAEAGTTITLYDGAVQVGTAQANAGGAWSITSATLGQGAHSLSATATDAAGNVSATSTALSVTIDTAAAAPAAPDLAAGSDSGVSNTDNITNAANPVFAGSGAEAGATVRLYAGATQVGSAVADASGNWSVTASGVAAGSGIVFTADQVDVAGNVSAVHSAGLTVTIDRTAPTAPSAPDLIVGSDSGVANTDNITNVAAPTFSGTAEAGATVILYDGVTQVGTAQANTGGAWSITSATLGQGAHSLSATATDAAGNVSVASTALSVTIDTAAAAPAAPDLVAGSDSGSSNTDNVTNAANPVFTGGGAEAGATVRLYAGATQVGSAVADASGNWSVTAGGVAAGSGIVFTADQVDVAGNVSAVHSAGLTVTIDRTAPTVPSVPDLIVGSDSGVSNIDNITNVAAPTFSGTAEAGATIKLYDGVTQVGTAQADAGGVWSITSATLGQGAHSLSTTATDAAGNVSATSAVLAVTIDTAAAAPAAPDLAAGSDSGSSNTDNVTNAANPVFTGGGAEAGATVRLYAGATQVGSAVADASGNWSVTASGVAAGSGIVFTADQVDVAGNVSAVHSAGLTVTIDRTAPTAPSVPDLIVGSDSGASNTDNITNVAAPTFSGTAEAGTTITLYDGAVQVGTAQADVGGAWSITSATLGQGAHSLSATATDAAGNVSVASAALAVTIDTAAAAPAAPDLVAGSDSGSSNTDNVTNAANPVFTGGGAEAGATVRLYAGATQVGSAVADASGNWSVTASGVVAGNGIVFTADQVDVAGNASAVHSAGLAVTIDRTPPVITISAPSLISNNTPTISGTGEAGGSVDILRNGTVIGSTVVNGSGTWSYGSAYLTDSSYTFSARETDVAGNTGSSGNVNVTVDTTAPDVSITGPSITKSHTPTLSGTGEVGGNVVVYDGPTYLGQTKVNGSGTWSLASGFSLADGIHNNVHADEGDAAGNVGTSSYIAITVDSIAPVVAITGPSITKSHTPTLSGTGEAGGTVLVYEGPTLLGQTTVNGSGTWSLASGFSLADGVHSNIYAGEVDAAGNVGTSSGITITVDSIAPVVTINGPSITKSHTPTLSGTGEPGGFLSVYEGSAEIGRTTVNSNGTWSLSSGFSFADGVHANIFAGEVDAAANIGVSGGITITVDSIAPVVTITGPGITKSHTPTLSGTGEPGGFLSVYEGSAEIGRTTVNSNGTWSLASGFSFADGVHTNIFAGEVDAAANIGVSGGITITVDSIAPTSSLTTTATTVSPNSLVNYTLNFSESVANVSAGDFTVNGGSISGISGSGASYIVSVLSGPTVGTLGLSLNAGTDIVDVAGNISTGAAANSVTISIPNTAPIIDSYVILSYDSRPATYQVVYHDNESTPSQLHDYAYIAGASSISYPNGDVVGGRVVHTYVSYINGVTVIDPQGLTASIGTYPPVILDLDGTGIDLLAPSTARPTLDINGDGIADYTGWAGPKNGFLVFDHNGDGKANDITELALSAYGPDGATDLEGLAYGFDSNHDGVFDSKDSAWSKFGVWRDGNQNGVSDQGEFQTLDEIGITAINLTRTGTFTGVNGSAVYGNTTFIWRDGHTGTVADVGLGYVSGTVVNTPSLTLQGTVAVDRFDVAGNIGQAVKVESFSSGGGDQIVLHQTISGLTFASADDVLARGHLVNGDFVIDLGPGATVTLVGVDAITAHNIVLVS